MVAPPLVVALPEESPIPLESRHRPRPDESARSPIQITQREPKHFRSAQCGNTIADGGAQGQMPSVDTTTLSKEVFDGIRALIVGDRRFDVAHFIPLPTDHCFNAGLIHCSVIGNPLEDLSECDHFASLEIDEVSLVVQVPE